MKDVIVVKTDKEVKRNAQMAARELGLALSDVINASLRNFIRTSEVYISAIPIMTPEFERIVGTIEQDVAKGKNLSPVFSDAEEAITYLKKA